MSFALPQELFEYFAASPAGLSEAGRIACDVNHPIHVTLERFLGSIPDETVDQKLEDDTFRALYLPRHSAATDETRRFARVLFAEEFLQQEISRRRLELICTAQEDLRPQPYTVPALADLAIGDDNLVSLTDFTYDGSRLERSEYSFLLLATTGAPNSTYWLLLALYQTGIASHVRVRLDPFLFGPAATMPAMFYRMLVHGRPLDWRRIAQLKHQEFGCWRGDTLSTRSEITDYCWTRRDDEIHFVCEEVPKTSDVLARPARYLHAIYDLGTQQITHFDGALRIYTPEGLTVRHNQHVRNAGKAGIREKVFRIDEPIPREVFSVVTQAFFIWNYDVARYFTDVLFESIPS